MLRLFHLGWVALAALGDLCAVGLGWAYIAILRRVESRSRNKHR
jgi:hypothetical protein